MRKSAYENSKIKHKLLNKKRNGVKEVIWKLNPNQVVFIQRNLGFNVEPYLYEVRTRTFYNIRNLDNFLKELHYKSKQGKDFIITELTPYQKNVLEELKIKNRIYKYKIKLI